MIPGTANFSTRRDTEQNRVSIAQTSIARLYDSVWRHLDGEGRSGAPFSNATCRRLSSTRRGRRIRPTKSNSHPHLATNHVTTTYGVVELHLDLHARCYSQPDPVSRTRPVQAGGPKLQAIQWLNARFSCAFVRYHQCTRGTPEDRPHASVTYVQPLIHMRPPSAHSTETESHPQVLVGLPGTLL